jgi:hypothetical protein
MRSFLRFFLVAALAFALGSCAKRPGPLPTAQHFFELLGSGQTDAAYQTAAFGFQAQRTSPAFAAAARDMGLTDYASGDWGQPERDGHTATIHVTVHTRAGTNIPLIVTLVDESGAWRVFSIHSPPSQSTGISENHFSLVGKVPNLNDDTVKPMPPEGEIKDLVRDNLVRFNAAIASASFDDFYESVSSKWQDQLTKGALQRAFQPFIDKKIDISGVSKIDPKFDTAPEINSEGLLLVSGHYDTQPYRVVFSMRFYYELPTWKLFGLDVNMVE